MPAPGLIQRRSRLASLICAGDVGAALGSFALVLAGRGFEPGDGRRFAVAVLFALSLPCAYALLGLYKREFWGRPSEHALRTAIGATAGFGLYAGAAALTGSDALLQRPVVLLNWCAALIGATLALRLGALPLIRLAIARLGWRRNVVVLGSGATARDYADRAHAARFAERRVIGFLDPALPGGACAELTRLAGLHRIQGAVIVAPELSDAELMARVRSCSEVFGWVEVHDPRLACLAGLLHADEYFGIPVVRFGSSLHSRAFRRYQRVASALGAALALLVSVPALACIALLVKCSSQGSILFKAQRVGHGRKQFEVYKFRSMTAAAAGPDRRAQAAEAAIADPDAAHAAKIRDESRITGVGRFLRRFGLDEVPQLLNVLKGEMALIGPRPSLLNEFALNADWHKQRFDVMPGCAGPWKIFAVRHGECSFNQMMLHDLYYAYNASPLVDLRVVSDTVRVMASGRVDG